MTILILCTAAVLVVPFLGAILEVFRPRDDRPLDVAVTWTRRERFYGISFRQKLIDALARVEPQVERPAPYVSRIHLARPDYVSVYPRGSIVRVPAGHEEAAIVFAQGHLQSEADCVFRNEIYVRGDAAIGVRNLLRAMAADGNVALSRGTTVLRWMDAQGAIQVESGCDLRGRVTAGETVWLQPNVVFKQIAAPAVLVAPRSPENAGPYDLALPTADTMDRRPVRPARERLVVDGDHVIAARERVTTDLLVRGRLHVGLGAIVEGNIKAYRGVVLNEGVVILGSVICLSDIDIGATCLIYGPVASDGGLRIGAGATIGCAPAYVTVYAARGIILSESVAVRGRMHTDGMGMVKCIEYSAVPFPS